jgi:drug/metabolite transporter (DMT)-like permease
MLSVLFVLVWSCGYLSGALATRDTPPFALSTWRFLAAGLILVIVAVLTKAPWPRGPKEWRDLTVTGLLLQATHFGGGYAAMALGVPAGLVALVLCLCPVVVAALAGPLLGERLGVAGRVGTAVAVLGTLVAGADHLDDGGTVWGFVFLLVGLAGFAGGTIYQKRSGATMDLRTGSAVQFLVAAAALAPFAALTEGGFPLPTTPVGIGALLWIILVNSLVGIVLLFALLRRGTGAGASGLIYLVPSVTAVLAVPVLGQPLEPQTIVGLAITLLGVVLVNRSSRADEREQPQLVVGEPQVQQR